MVAVVSYSRMLKIFLLALALINCAQANNAQKQVATVNKPMINSSSNNTNTSSQSLIGIIKSSLHDNSLRAGFEPFYFITNLFIDELFVPKIPKGKYKD